MLSSHGRNVRREGLDGVYMIHNQRAGQPYACASHPSHPALGPRVLGGLLSLWLPIGFGKCGVPTGPWRVGGQCSRSVHVLIPPTGPTLVDGIPSPLSLLWPHGSAATLSPHPVRHSSGNAPNLCSRRVLHCSLLSSHIPSPLCKRPSIKLFSIILLVCAT